MEADMRKITWYQMAGVILAVTGEMILLGFYLIAEAINETLRR